MMAIFSIDIEVKLMLDCISSVILSHYPDFGVDEFYFSFTWGSNPSDNSNIRYLGFAYRLKSEYLDKRVFMTIDRYHFALTPEEIHFCQGKILSSDVKKGIFFTAIPQETI